MISPKIEESRIKFALRNCEEKSIPIFEPMNLIQKVIDESSTPGISWSGGKCSTVVLHMAIQIKPKILVFFNDTGVEFPETYDYVQDITEKWNLNLVRSKANVTFWQIVEKYGFPQFRVMGFDKDSKKRAHIPKCCVLLKEKPFKLNAKALKIDCNMTGIRLAESRPRAFIISQKGQYYFNKHYGFRVAHPIAFWTEEQVSKYLEQNGIPINGLYLKGQRRNGCWPCTGFKSWAESLARSHPKMYKFLSKKIGKPTLDEFLAKNVDFEEEREKAILDFQCRQAFLEEWF